MSFKLILCYIIAHNSSCRIQNNAFSNKMVALYLHACKNVIFGDLEMFRCVIDDIWLNLGII